MKLLRPTDASALTLYVEAFERYRIAAEKVRAEGQISETPNGYPIVSPWLSIMNKQGDICRRYLIEFGLTPAVRARMALPTAKADAEWTEILKQGG